ncbi:hypothetical protein [Pseudomonas sp. LB3P14]
MLHQTTFGGTNRPVVTPDQGQGSRPDGSGPSRIEISDLPSVQPESHAGLSSYLLNSALLRNMQPADDDGFRFIVGRTFVDVKDIGTVQVEFDTGLGAYRATDLYKKLPPGPGLFKNANEATWSPARQVDSQSPLKRPPTRSMTATRSCRPNNC